MTTLDLTTTTQLVDELKRRYPLLIVAGSDGEDATRASDILFYHGKDLSLIGLCRTMEHDLTRQYWGRLEPMDDTP